VADGDVVVIGVSGGPDSMALLHALAASAPRLAISLAVAHADHGLRPDEAPAEAAVARAGAEQIGAPFFERRLDTRAHAGKHGMSIEEAARDLRYAFFHDVAGRLRGRGGVKIAVAHNADDQAEEVLIRLLRGAGRKGLAGMAVSRAGTIIRPMLGVAKAEGMAYLADKKIAYCLDSSNTDPRFLRNRVRHELLPYLETFSPGAAGVLRRTAAILGAEDDLLDAMATEAWRRVVLEHRFTEEKEKVIVDRPAFAALHLATRRRVAEMVFCRLGEKPSFARIQAVIDLAGNGGGGERHFHLGLRLVKDGDRLLFSYPRGRRPLRGRL